MSSIEEVNHLHIPIQELSDATNAFSDANLLGRGGFGTVYKGVSVKHGSIAIKMLDPWQGPGKGQGDHEFKTEIALLSVYKHENIVSLLGYCDEDGKKILVYKYESNGSLDKHLKRKDLTWIQRLQICLDAARGLQYLHDDVEAQIFHRDIKSSNILLDENLKAKISDFGLSRIDSVNEHSFLISNPCGTYGYIDPEYTSTGCLTQKSDVYSFGVVLFEVLCGRLACVTAYRDERQFLTNLIKIHWGRKTLNEIIYSDLKSQINRVSLVTFSRIAYQCLMSGNERPTMKKVVEQLQKALDEQLIKKASLVTFSRIAYQCLKSGNERPTIKKASLVTFSRIAYQCLKSGNERPTMKKVVEQLQKALDEQLTLTLENENPESKPKVERSTGKKAENSVQLPEPPKQDYIHVRARIGEATDSHSLAERITEKALMLDEIINDVRKIATTTGRVFKFKNG